MSKNVFYSMFTQPSLKYESNFVEIGSKFRAFHIMKFNIGEWIIIWTIFSVFLFEIKLY